MQQHGGPMGDMNQNNFANENNGEYDEWEPVEQKSQGSQYNSNGDTNLDRGGGDYFGEILF